MDAPIAAVGHYIYVLPADYACIPFAISSATSMHGSLQAHKIKRTKTGGEAGGKRSEPSHKPFLF